MPFDRKTYFDYVRHALFQGHLTQQQVDGQEYILTAWETYLEPRGWELRHLAYPLATTLHETASTMWPIEEYGKGAGAEYGEIDPETGEAYYGRGDVMLTWRDNYAKADQELAKFGIEIDCEHHPDQQLEPPIAAATMFIGMSQGWFRTDEEGRQTLDRYFNDVTDDAYGAREIINGDKTRIPDWSNGVSIGNLIRGYHEEFLEALTRSYSSVEPVPEPSKSVDIAITTSEGVQVTVIVNGIPVALKGL